MLFVLPLLRDLSLPGGMKMEKILSFLPCILCWLLGAKPMPRPGGPAYPLRGLGSLLLQEQYPGRSQQPLSSKDVVVGPRMPAMWKEKKESEEGLETEEEKARWSAKGGNELDKDGGHPLLFHSRQACLQPPLRFFLTLFPRPVPVQKPSWLPQFTPSYLFPLLSALIQGPIQCCLPISPLYWGSCVLL